MNKEDVQLFRRGRLREAAEKTGSNAALGRMLGYKDGSFVGQMLRGERPVSEDTVSEIEAMHGFRGWFSEESAAPLQATPLRPGEEDGDDPLTVMRLGTPEERREIYDKLRLIAVKNRTRMTNREFSKIMTSIDKSEGLE